VKLTLTTEQLAVAAVAAKFLSQELPLARVRELAADHVSPLAIDDVTWQRCADMGWFALGLSESRGGVGFGPVEEIVLFRELGRYLAPGPFLSTVVAGWVAAGVGNEALATSLFEGGRRAGLAVGQFVLDAEPGGLVVHFTDGACEVREVGRLDAAPSVDPSVRLARSGPGSLVERLEEPMLLARAQLLVSAMELGIAEAVRDMSVEYAKERIQFGKPIGSFQAVKHRCSDMAIRVHAAHAQVMFAGFSVGSRATDSQFQAAAAKLVATKAAKLNTIDNVQNHGAIGFTVEHDAGLFARRAHMLEFALGGEAVARPSVLAIDRHRFENDAPPVDDWFGEGETAPGGS
jgi:alkylation response protein AidB-like acyl-CoA dehydrogenase